ncbi:MAG: glycosyltransferase, partial [bacterium]
MRVKIAYFVERYRGFRTYVYDELNNLKTFTPIFLAEEMWNQNHLSPELKIFSRSNLSWLERLKGGYFKRVLLAERAKLLRAYFGHGGIKMLPVSEKLNIPLVTSFHGALVTSISRSWCYLRRQKTLFRKGDLFLARSEDTKKEMVDLGCSPEKIIVHYGGVDV